MTRYTASCACALIALHAGAAGATYSIVATDSSTGQVGGAGTSCVGAMDVFIIYGSAPGHGAVHAQAYVNTAGRDEAARLLETDTPPDEIIAAITAPSFDPNASRRQYGVVDLSGGAAGYTGSANGDYADDAQGTVGTFTYSVQGNILTSGAVITNAAAAFEAAGCDLADRLMLALEAGATGDEGDSRCTPDGIPSDAGFIHVDLEDGTDLIHIAVTDTSPDSPLPMLRELFDEWRADHPCPGPPVEEEPDASSDAVEDPGWDPAEDVEPAGDPPADMVEDATVDAVEEAAEPRISTGCGCSVPAGRIPAVAWVLAVLLLVLRRKPE